MFPSGRMFDAATVSCPACCPSQHADDGHDAGLQAQAVAVLRLPHQVSCVRDETKYMQYSSSSTVSTMVQLPPVYAVPMMSREL